MDYPVQDIQFLDLTDADDEERDFLHTTLFTRNPTLKYPELPWITHPDFSCAPAGWRPAPYASGEPGEGSSTVLEGGDCDTTITQNAASPAAHQIPGEVPEEPQSLAGSGSHANPVYPDASVMTVPPPVPTSVPAPAQPSVITTMYHQIVPGLPLSNVYVGNVTANVNVHGFMSAPLAAYPHMSPQPVYTGEVPHEQVPPVRNGGREARRGRSNKISGKRVDGQYVDRNSTGRHSQDVIPTQPPPLVDSPPTGNSNMPPQSFAQFIPMHYQTPYYPPPAPAHPPHHLPHHPSAQHATGTPIYLPSHHPMYPQPPLYSGYTPHHQPPSGPPLMPFPAMQNAPVPTTENSMMGGYPVENSGVEEHINKEADEHPQKHSPSPVCASYQPEPVVEAPVLKNSISEPVTSVKPPSYQQQQSEEDEYNQTNLMNTVVVNNRNIVTEPLPFVENKQSGVVESVNRNMPQSTGHQNFNDSAKFLSEKVKVPAKEVDSIALNKSSRVNVSSEMSVNTSVVDSDSDTKKDKAVVNINTLPAAAVDQEKCQIVDVKTSLPHVDVPASAVTTPKPAVGHHVDSVPPFPVGSQQPVNTPTAVQHQTVGQSAHGLPAASHSVEIPSTTPVVTPTTGHQKSWASLFQKNAMLSSPRDTGMMITGPQPGAGSASKPLACVKPYQNAVVTPDSSRRVSEVSSTAHSVSPASSPGVPNLATDRDNFPQLASPSSDDPHLYRLGEFLSKYQLEHKALSLQPRGLTNRSNWCYINSTLQALLACPPFYNLMKALSLPPKRSAKSTTPIIDSMVQFVNEFMPLSAANRLRDRKEKALRKDDGSIEVQCGAPFEPSYIYKMLNSIRSDTFKVEGRQEDAEEFLGCLLNALNDEMLELIKLVEEPTTKSTLSNGDITANGETSVQSQDEDDTEWKVMGPKNKGSITRRADFGRTPISDIFRGQLRSRVQRAGDQSTDNVQPFFTLQLDIEKAQSVKDALEILVGRDQLEGVTCSRTNQEVEAWQQVTLEELPLVLLLHLKWFDYKLDGASKIVKCVEFPIDLKVDAKLISTSSKKYGPKQRQYKLFAVVYHDGKEATKGHYITDVFHVGYGGWVRYDDSVVKAVQESNVLRPRGPRVPYLLYYRRFDTIGNTQTTPTSDKTR